MRTGLFSILIVCLVAAAGCSRDTNSPVDRNVLAADRSGVVDPSKLKPMPSSTAFLAFSQFAGRGSPLTVSEGVVGIKDGCVVLTRGRRSALLAVPQGSVLARSKDGRLFLVLGGIRSNQEFDDVVELGKPVRLIGGLFAVSNVQGVVPQQCPRSAVFGARKT